MKIEERDRELFDRYSAEYSKKFSVPYCILGKKLRLSQTLLGLKRPFGSVLEVGCGPGFNASYLAQDFNSYTGLDYSEGLISIANDLHSGPKTNFVCANLKDFESDRKFDLIVIIGVLHHMTELDAVVAKLGSLLTDGGTIAINEPQKGNPLISILRKLRKFFDGKYSEDQVEFKPAELRQLFERHGFSVSVSPQGFLTTPFTETTFFPEWLGVVFMRVFIKLDPLLERLARFLPFSSLAWNVVARADLPPKKWTPS